MKLKPRKGKTYGLLTVIRRDKKRMDRVYWTVKCSCGTIKSVRADKLGKSTVSCGCYNRELIRKSREGSDSSMFKTSKRRLFYYSVVKPLHDQIKKRDGNRCALCKTKKNLHVHHILRKSKFRLYLLEPCNLISLCENCHFLDAHSGNTNTVNWSLASTLLSIVFINEQLNPTSQLLIDRVAEKAKPFLLK